jgi:hypothetical protein
LKRLLYLGDLAKMDGGTMQSINGKEWTVSNVDGTILLSSDGGVLVGVGAEQLTRNGTMHCLQNGLLLDKAEHETPTSAPILEPTTQNQTLQPACDVGINQNGSLPDGLL